MLEFDIADIYYYIKPTEGQAKDSAWSLGDLAEKLDAADNIANGAETACRCQSTPQASAFRLFPRPRQDRTCDTRSRKPALYSGL